MTDLSPRQRRHERTREAILTAAREIVATEGVAKLSLRGIARRIDYSPAGLYEYFGSKDEIVSAVCEQGHQRLAAYMRRADSSLPAAEYLAAIGLAYINFAIDHPEQYKLMFSEAPSIAVVMSLLSEESSFRILVGAIERGVAEGVFKIRENLGVSEMTHAAWSIVHGIAMLRITYLKTSAIAYDYAYHDILLAFNRGLGAD